MPYFLLILTTLLWSGNFVLSRGMHAEIPPFSLSFWRWVVALLILSCFALRHLLAQRKLAIKHKKFIIIQGVVGVAGFNSFVYMAMQTTTAINAVLVNSCIPVLIAVSDVRLPMPNPYTLVTPRSARRKKRLTRVVEALVGLSTPPHMD